MIPGAGFGHASVEHYAVINMLAVWLTFLHAAGSWMFDWCSLRGSLARQPSGGVVVACLGRCLARSAVDGCGGLFAPTRLGNRGTVVWTKLGKRPAAGEPQYALSLAVVEFFLACGRTLRALHNSVEFWASVFMVPVLRSWCWHACVLESSGVMPIRGRSGLCAARTVRRAGGVPHGRRDGRRLSSGTLCLCGVSDGANL